MIWKSPFLRRGEKEDEEEGKGKGQLVKVKRKKERKEREDGDLGSPKWKLMRGQRREVGMIYLKSQTVVST